MLYHVSPTAGLKVLKPHVSSHQKAYVYAIEDIVTGMLFGTKKDDFDIAITTDSDGISNVYECYPDAFRKVYGGKSCSVYEVREEGFQRGMTSWTPELVCEQEVAVINEIAIQDLHQRLTEEEQKGNLKIHRYEFCEEYRKRISSHIVDRLIRFGIDLENCTRTDPRFSLYYRDIVQGLLHVMDGHLLQ